MVWSREYEPALSFSFSPQSKLQFCSLAACCEEEEGIGSPRCLYFVYKIWGIERVTKPGFEDLQHSFVLV